MKKILSLVLCFSLILSFFVGVRVFTPNEKVKADNIEAAFLGDKPIGTIWLDDDGHKWGILSTKEIELENGDRVNAVVNSSVLTGYNNKMTLNKVKEYIDESGKPFARTYWCYYLTGLESCDYAKSDIKKAIEYWFNKKSDNMKNTVYKRRINEDAFICSTNDVIDGKFFYGTHFNGEEVLTEGPFRLDFVSQCYAPSYFDFDQNHITVYSSKALISSSYNLRFFTRHACGFKNAYSNYNDYYQIMEMELDTPLRAFGSNPQSKEWVVRFGEDATSGDGFNQAGLINPSVSMPKESVIIKQDDNWKLADYNGDLFNKVGYEKACAFLKTAGASEAHSFITGVGTDESGINKINTFIKNAGPTGEEAGEFVKKAGGVKAAEAVLNCNPKDLALFIKTAKQSAGNFLNLVGVDKTIEYINKYTPKYFSGVTIEDKMIFLTKDNKKVLFRCTSDKGNITIPNGTQVIGSEAFNGNTTAEVITIPYSVTYISSGAFDNLRTDEDLDLIIRFRSLDCVIEDGAFIDNEKTFFECYKGSSAYEYGKDKSFTQDALAEVKTTIEDGDFDDSIDTMTSFTVPEGVKEIGDNAFDGFTYLKTVNFSNVEKIGENAFAGTRLKGELLMPDTVTEVGDGAFDDTNVTRILVGKNTKTGESVNKNGDAVQTTGSVQFGFIFNEIVLTKDWVRANLKNGKTGVEVGPYCEEIEDGAFEGSELTSINLTKAKSLERIGNNAFKGTQITDIYIGGSVAEVGEDAFSGCPLTEITVENPNLDITTSLGGVTLSTLTVVADKNSVTEEKLRNSEVTVEIKISKNLVDVILIDGDQTRNVKLPSGIKQKITPPLGDNTKTFLGYYDSTNKQYFDEEGNQLFTISSQIRLTAKYGNACVIIKFDANGGEGTMDDVKVEIPMPASLPDKYHVGFTKEGYKFAGWAKFPNGYAFDDPTMDTSEYNGGDTITLYAIWKKSFTISLIGNDELETSESGEILIPKTTKAEIPEGKVLIGYSKEENSGKVDYEVGKTYKFTGNEKIYPVFANGGVKYKLIIKKMAGVKDGKPYYETTEKELTGIENTEITAAPSVYGKDGVTIATEGEFELEKGYVINPESTLTGTITKDLVLTAILDKTKVKLVFDANGKDVTVPAPIEDYWGEEIILDQKIDNEDFRGWGVDSVQDKVILDKDGNTVYAFYTDINEFPITASYKLIENNTVLSITWDSGQEFILLTELGYTIDTTKDNEIIFDSKTKGKTYRIVIKATLTSNESNVITRGNTATYVVGKNKKTLKVPDTIKKDGKTYKITTISANAFKGMNKIKTVTFGKYVAKVGKNAMKGLKITSITFKSKKVTLEKGSLANLKLKKFKYNKLSLKSGSLKGTKATFKKKDKKAILKAGANKKSKFK